MKTRLVWLALVSCAPAIPTTMPQPVPTSSAMAAEPRVDIAGPTPPTTPQPASTHKIVIRAGRVLDPKSGKILTNVTIAIENDKVVALNGAVPQDATVIDLPNATVLPG